MAKRKRSSRTWRPKFANPQDAINAICSDLTHGLDVMLRRQAGVSKSSELSGEKSFATIYEIATDKPLLVAFGTPMCTFIKQGKLLKLQFRYRYKRHRGKWSTRSMSFPMLTSSQDMVSAVLQDMADKAAGKRTSRRK